MWILKVKYHMYEKLQVILVFQITCRHWVRMHKNISKHLATACRVCLNRIRAVTLWRKLQMSWYHTLIPVEEACLLDFNFHIVLVRGRMTRIEVSQRSGSIVTHLTLLYPFSWLILLYLLTPILFYVYDNDEECNTPFPVGYQMWAYIFNW